MAVKYLSGGRVQGLEKAEVTPTVSNDMSSATGWTVVGSNISVTSGSVQAASLVTNTDNRIHYDLGSTLGTKFVVDFDYYADTASNGAYFCGFAITETTNAVRDDDGIYGLIDMGSWGTYLRYSNEGSETNVGLLGNLTTGAWQYHRFVRDGTTGTLTVYSDAARTSQVLQVTGTIPATVTGLRYFQTGAIDGGNAGTTSFKVDNLKVWNNVTITTTEEKEGLSDVPAYTMFEETDTQKMYVRNPNAPNTTVSWTPRNSAHTGAYRGIFAGGNTGSADVNTMDYITIGTLGNATDFGDLTDARALLGACADATRGVWAGGKADYTNTMDYVTIATAGNATDFGDNTTENAYLAGCASDVRGCFGGGWRTGYSNVISYITIQTTGNASDFGDLISAREQPAACSDLVRGVWYGGSTSGDIDYVTIATTGNATDFGANATEGGTKGHAGVSNNVRGVFTGHSGETDIDYITIQTTGTVTNFGDQAVQHAYTGGVQGGERGVWGGGEDSSSKLNIIDYVTISTTGNSVDFGDMTQARGSLAGASGA